jgi:hypothetical protein
MLIGFNFGGIYIYILYIVTAKPHIKLVYETFIITTKSDIKLMYETPISYI